MLDSVITPHPQAVQECIPMMQAEDFRALVEGANDVIWAARLDSIITYLSPKFIDMFGYAPDEWIGRSFVPLTHHEDVPMVLEMVQQCVASGQAQETSAFRYLKKTGEVGWITSNFAPIWNESHEIIGLQGILRDVSKQRLVEVALQEQVARQTLLNHLTAQIRNSLEFETIIDTTLNALSGLLQIDSCAFAWYVPDEGSSYWQVLQTVNNGKIRCAAGSYPSEFCWISIRC